MSMPKPIANFETYLTAAMSPAATTFTIFDVTDDSGTSLNGKTCWFTIDSERILATVNGSTKVCTVVLRGVDPNVSTEEVADLKVEHEKGAPVRITDAHYLLQLTEMLSGDIALQGVPTLPAARTISTARQIIDKEYADAISVASFADFATVDAGGLNIDVNAGTLVTDDGVIEYAGSSAVAMTDDATNYVQLTPAGTLAVNTTGWINGYVPLSKVVTVGGDITSISLNRGLITAPAGDKNITTDFTYGDTISAGNPVYLDTADGKWKRTSGASSATAAGHIGIALDAGVNNDTGKRVQTDGVVDILSGLTPGYVYLGDTTATLSSTPGTFRKAIGRAITTTKMVLMDTFQVARLTGANADATTTNFNKAMTFFNSAPSIGASDGDKILGGPDSYADALHTHTSPFGFSILIDAGSGNVDAFAFGTNLATPNTFAMSAIDAGATQSGWNGWNVASDFGSQFYTVAQAQNQNTANLTTLGGAILIGDDMFQSQQAGSSKIYKNTTDLTFSGTARAGAISYDPTNQLLLVQYAATTVAKFSGVSGTTLTNQNADVTLDTAVDTDKAFVYDPISQRYIFVDTTNNIVRRFSAVGATIDTVPYTITDTYVRGVTVIKGRVHLIVSPPGIFASGINGLSVEFVATTMTL